MLLTEFLQHFGEQRPERFRTLAASSAGRCARALAMAHFPERYPPESMSPRRRARLTAGILMEDHCLDIIKSRLPGIMARETAFLWPVPCAPKVIEAAIRKVDEGRLLGFVLPDFQRHDIARWRQACQARGLSRLGGIIIDPVTATIFLPALPDGLADLAEYHLGFATIEFKTISTAGFRDVQRGRLDYSYRTQFAVQVDAAEVDTHIGLFYRLETSHGIEIIYSRHVDRVRVELTLTNGQRLVVDEGMTPNVEWDEMSIETPFEPGLLEQARERVRSVLVAGADSLPEREYGPSFVCRKCAGRGWKVCGYCAGTGISKRSKTGKDCNPCRESSGSPGRLICKACESGHVAETELSFPCGWCAFVRHCYAVEGTPIYTLEIDQRPHYRIKRAEYEAAGITFTPPEVEVVEAEVETLAPVAESAA